MKPDAHGYSHTKGIPGLRRAKPNYYGRRFNVEIDPGQLSQLTHVRLYPGMPVEVAVVTGDRTMLDYLVQPMVDSFSRAFTEE